MDPAAAQCSGGWRERRERGELKNQIRRGVEEQPVFAVGGNYGGRLGEEGSGPAGGAAMKAVTVPLWNSATGRRSKDSYLHGFKRNRRGLGRSYFSGTSLFAGIHVSRDFHAQADFFKFRFDPVHTFVWLVGLQRGQT